MVSMKNLLFPCFLTLVFASLCLTGCAGKLGAPIDADVFEIKMLKRPIVALLESDQDRRHLTWMQPSRSPACFKGCRLRETLC